MKHGVERYRGTSAFALALVLSAAFALVLLQPGVSSASPTSPVNLSIVPAPNRSTFNDNQTLKVSAGPNLRFVPYSRVVILECADPGGTTANLPQSLLQCDENTVQGDTTLVKADGSFNEPAYSIFALPSKILGEQSNSQPDCSATSMCVLFVGENQNDFTQAKVFSQPFFMSTPVAASPAAVPASTAGPLSTTPAMNVSPQVTLAPATLAYTGTSSWLWGELVLGVGLVAAAVLLGRALGGARR
jgi:hypothetical protein